MFAPYVGIESKRAFGATADDVEAAGEEAETTRFMIGLKTWFQANPSQVGVRRDRAQV